MVQLFEASVVHYLKNLFFDKVGINVPFKFSPSMSFIKEFRRDRTSKLNTILYKDIIKECIGEETELMNLAIWGRDPLTRDDNRGKNSPYDQLAIETDSGATLRDTFYGKTTFQIQMFSSENKIIHLLEMIYNIDFVKNKTIDITYVVDNEELEIPYQTNFSEIESLEFIDTDSYGGMMLISFNVEVSGLFFSPFYTVAKTIKEVDLKVFTMDKSLNINEIENYNENTLSCERKCLVDDEDTKLIIEETCLSLNKDKEVDKIS